MIRTAVLPAALVGLAVAVSGCTSSGAGIITAASSSPFTMDPSTLPTGKVAARDDHGGDWYVTVLQSYYAASEQVCMNATIAPAATPMATPVASILCRQDNGWRVARPLRSDAREIGTRLPDRLIL